MPVHSMAHHHHQLSFFSTPTPIKDSVGDDGGEEACSAGLGLSRQCGLGKPMASIPSFTRRLGARGLQGGSPGHTHYQVHLENM